MTHLKEKRFFSELANPNVKSVYEASQRAGYTPQSRVVYSPAKKLKIAEYLKNTGYSLEALKAKFAETSELAKKKGDLTNLHRGLENITKMQGGFIERVESENKTTLSFVSPEEKLELDRLRGIVHSANDTPGGTVVDNNHDT